MLNFKKVFMGILSIALVSVYLSANIVSADSTNYERVTWNQLEEENFDIDSITKEDIQKADEVSGDLGGSLFKEDQDGFATMDISFIKEKYGEDVANVFKLGLANINIDIENGITKFADNHKSFVKGPNYDKYVEKDSNSKGQISNEACSIKGGGKAVVSGAIGGAIGAGVVSGGSAALPAGAIGGVGTGAGYYATCWW